MSKYIVILQACKINATTYLFIPVKMCSLIFDYSEHLFRPQREVHKADNENQMIVEFDFP